MSNREGPKATASFSRNWLILFATLILVGIAAFLLQLLMGPDVAGLVTVVAIALIAVFAFADGAWRLLGNEGFLGPGTGFDRLLAVIQVLLALGVLIQIVSG